MGGLDGSLKGLGNLLINSFLILFFSCPSSKSVSQYIFLDNRYFKNLLSVLDDTLIILI